MKKWLLFIGSLVAVFSLSGCSTGDISNMVSEGSAVPSSSAHASSIHSSKVKVYYGNAGLPKHYKVVGRVSAENYNMVGIEHSQASIAEELEKQAASLGANGVINISTGLTETTGDAIITK